MGSLGKVYKIVYFKQKQTQLNNEKHKSKRK